MARRIDNYRLKRGDDLGDPAFWNRILEDLDLRLHDRELDGDRLGGAIDALTAAALARLNDTFTPLVQAAAEQLQNVGARFVGVSSSDVTVGLGGRSFVLTDETRDGYVVTDYVVARPVIDGDIQDEIGLVGQVISYERDSGLLIVDVVVASGEGSYSDWQIRLSAPPDLEHAGRTDNPHEVTAAQVGAPTLEAMSSAISAVTTAFGEALDDLSNATAEALDGKSNNGHVHAAEAITFSSAGITADNARDAIAEVNAKFPVYAPRGHLYGLTLSNNVSDSDHDIDIAPGECASDDASSVKLVLAAALTKRIDAAWSVGNGGGGMDTGSVQQSASYHVWLIRRSDTGVVDALFSASATSPTMPANYDQKRRIGAVVTDGSANIRAFTQYGDEFTLHTAVQDVSVNNSNTTAVLRALSVPAGIPVTAIFAASQTNTNTNISHWFTTPAQSNQSPDDTGFAMLWNQGTNTSGRAAGLFRVRTDTSRRIRSRCNSDSGTTHLQINTLGWVDERGRS